MSVAYSYRSKVFWLTFVVFSFLCFPVQGAQWTVRAKWVPDGDTLFLVSGEKIRLRGIDCPETSHGTAKAQYYSKEARKYLWHLVRGVDLRMDTDQIQADRYGRIVTWVYLPDGRLLNLCMVEEGYAFYYPHSRRPDPTSKELLRAQRRAMDGLRGMWARILRLPVAGNAYIGNSNSKRFHTLTCLYGKKINKKNRKYFSTLRQAFYAGYAPCRTCTPWPTQ